MQKPLHVQDYQKIDISAEKEVLITIEDIYEWYTEAEKLIRVLANILSVPMQQAINQLRYAGHHIVKSQCSGVSEEERQQNLIESYKHCKRAVYDALDFYVYKLNEYYRCLLPLLKKQEAIKIEGILSNYIVQINQCRMECGTRIEYYSGIQNSLIDGLKLVEQLNEIQRESDVTSQLFQEKSQLCREISTLRNNVNELQAEIAVRDGKDTKSGYTIALVIAIILAAGTFFGLAVDAFFASHHEVVIKGPV